MQIFLRPYNELLNTTWRALYLLVITYHLNKLRHTSEVKEKTRLFWTVYVSEGLKVSLEAVVYSNTKKKMRGELFLVNWGKFINLTFFHGRYKY